MAEQYQFVTTPKFNPVVIFTEDMNDGAVVKCTHAELAKMVKWCNSYQRNLERAAERGKKIRDQNKEKDKEKAKEKAKEKEDEIINIGEVLQKFNVTEELGSFC